MIDDAPTQRSRTVALLVLCASALMVILDETIVNVALPAIQGDLGFSQPGLAWVVNAYLVAFGGLLLLAGRLGDLIGRRRLFLAGLALFTAASVLCGLAPSAEWLVAARFLQGAGGALATAVTLGMIVALYPEPRERAKAIGVFSFVQASGGSLGLLAGGVVTETVGWSWVFFVNVPIGLAAAAAALRYVPATPGLGLARGADAAGAVLLVAAVMTAVLALVGAADHGWASARTLGLGALALGLLAAFVAREAHARSPLVPLRIFRVRTVAVANGIQAIAIAGLFGIQFLGTLYLQRVLGYGPLEQGLAFLPLVIGIAAVSLGVSGRAINRIGAPAVLLPGLALIAAGLAYLARGPVDATYAVDVLPAMLVLGVGGGLAIPALMTLVMSAATEADAGLASGLATTTQQVGGALGLAIVAALAAGRSETLRADGVDAAHALAGGFHLGFAVGAGLVTLALVLAAVLLRPRRRTGDGAQRTRSTVRDTVACPDGAVARTNAT